VIFKLFQLLLSLPQILELIGHIDKQAQEAEEKRKVKDDLKKINEAFRNKNAKLLRDTFDAD
jgi:hypothetical protein